MLFMLRLTAAFAFALFLAVPVAGPGAASAQGAIDLSGEWRGESSGNRVVITVRPGGIEVTPVTQNAGQTATAMFYREVTPGRYQLTLPDGSTSVAQALGSDSLRVTNSTGWTDVFSRTSRAAAEAQASPALPEWFFGRWVGDNENCADQADHRSDGSYVLPNGRAARWYFEGNNFIIEGGGQRYVFTVERIDADRVRISTPGSAPGIRYRCEGMQRAAPARPSAVAQPQLPATATVRVRLAGYYGTRCVIPSIRNVRRPQEANPHPTSWIGDWTLTNNCPVAQWVRIETDGAGHIFWSGLQTPGARMGPNPNLVPPLPFQPIREHDFGFGWLVPASSDLVTGTLPVSQGGIDHGLDVWIASCDAVGDARQQAIYLSAPFRSSPRVTCYNHALPNGGTDAR